MRLALSAKRGLPPNGFASTTGINGLTTSDLCLILSPHLRRFLAHQWGVTLVALVLILMITFARAQVSPFMALGNDSKSLLSG